MKKIGQLIFAIILLTGLFSQDVWAQAAVNEIGENLRYSEISAKLNKIDAQLKKENITSGALSEDIDYLRKLRMQLENSKKEIEGDIKFVEKKVEALGEAPADGNEVKIIAQKRKEFQKDLAEERARLSEAELLLTRIDELDLAIFNLRNQELWGNLLISSEPLIYPSTFISSGKMFLGLIGDIVESPLPWYEKLSEENKAKLQSNLLPVLLVIIFISFIGWWLRKLILRSFGYLPEVEHPRFGRKIFAAVMVWIAYGVIPTSIIGFLLVWIIHGKILATGFLGLVLSSFLYYSLYVIMCNAICRVIFTPYNERWRLINIPTDRAKRVVSALYISVTLVGTMAFLRHIVSVHNYPIELLTFLIAASASIKAFCMVWILHRLLWENHPTPTDAELAEMEDKDGEDDSEDETEDADTFVVKLTLFSMLIALGIVGLSALGYPYLALFITDRIVLSIVLCGVFMGLRKVIHEVLHRILFLKFWFKTFRMRRRVIRKLDFWSSFLIDPVLALSGFFIFLALWGVPSDILRGIIYKLFTGFTIGDIRISLLSIILGIVVFLVLIAIVKSLRQKIENGLLARMEIEEGTRHSLAAGFSSIGYVASALLAIVIMGGNLTSLALVAGALSVGIGLGLQNVVNNFVSGIILLFERPIKVGDWVIVNGEEGRVKQINIRSTEIETFRKSSLIIPNADLLSNTVTNLTHGNNWSRQSVCVGVAYGTDTEKVRDILLECAANHKRVLRKPEPYVLFKDFGASSLDFELRCYTSDIWSGWSIPSDLRYEINRRFAEEGIEIPFNQLVVHSGNTASEEDKASKDLPKKGKKNAD